MRFASTGNASTIRSNKYVCLLVGVILLAGQQINALPSASQSHTLTQRSSSLRPYRWLSAFSGDYYGSFENHLEGLEGLEGEAFDTLDTLDALADPPRLPIPPLAATEGGSGGWLTRWLSIGGEGAVAVHLSPHHNITIPHRPSAFPSTLLRPLTLPLSGFLTPFTSLLDDTTSTSLGHSPTLACLPPFFPPPDSLPQEPYLVALIERGECDFASKVRAAQDRGAAAVIVGDGKLRDDETDDEGKKRENLITMFSPEDTEAIYLPSVFVSRASYILLRELLANGTNSGRKEGKGLWIQIGEGKDEGGALSSLLSFALLMPSLFLLATIAIHRLRVARQREADRAPPLLVLSLPERIWTPDIVWEKDSDTDSVAPGSPRSTHSPTLPTPGPTPEDEDVGVQVPPPPPISPSDLPTPPLERVEISLSGPSQIAKKRTRSKSGVSQQKYFSKDECAICMDQFQSGDVVRILPCGHVFHKDECDEWLLKWRKLCPTCRADVTLPPGETASGTTITPVSVQVDEGDILHRTWRERVSMAARSAWRGVTGRTSGLSIEEGDIAGERTPLVARSPNGTQARDEAV